MDSGIILLQWCAVRPLSTRYLTLLRLGRPEERHAFEGSVQGSLGGESEPVFQDRRVNAAEVDRHFQIAVDQIGQARIRPDQSWLNVRASQKHRTGCAVVSAGDSHSRQRAVRIH